MKTQKYQKGFSIELLLPALAAMAVIALAVVVLVTGGVTYGLTKFFSGDKKEAPQQVTETAGFSGRANDLLKAKSLKPITMEAFAKTTACPADIPYGSKFVAESEDSKVVKGQVCMASNREGKLIIS